jgi:hypothetical protein
MRYGAVSFTGLGKHHALDAATICEIPIAGQVLGQRQRRRRIAPVGALRIC